MTQRGNRRAPIFFERGDQRVYLRLLAEQTNRYGVEVWSYCLMPNHVHLILTPVDQSGLARALGEAHRRYVAYVNGRQGWTGHLFQDRFSSVAMDEEHFLAAARYVALNPVRARLAERPQDWPWSSVHAHLAGKDDEVVRVKPLLQRVELGDLLRVGEVADHLYAHAFARLRRAETSPGGLVGGVLTSRGATAVQGTAYAVPSPAGDRTA